MKNLKLKWLPVLFFAAVVLSCSKDDDNQAIVYPQENPLTGYLTTSGFDDETAEAVNSGDFEFGYKFRPTVTGAITSLSVKIPDVNSSLRVTIWDVSAATAIKTELFNVTSSGVTVTKAIPALGLVKDKEYMITMNSNDWYTRNQTGNTATTYPITVGNIQVTGYAWGSGTVQTMPTINDNTYYAGDATFTFQRVL